MIESRDFSLLFECTMNFSKFAFLPLLLGATSCVSDSSISTYSPDAVGATQQTLYGTIISAQPVIVSSSSPNTGTAVGGAAGAAMGAMVGGQDHRLLGAGLGGAAGLLGGHFIGKKVGTKKAVQYQVRVDSGIVYSMIQDPGLKVNQRVIVILSNGSVPGKLIPHLG